MRIEPPNPVIVADNVRAALAEDVGSGDITARLVPIDRTRRAKVISRQNAVVCGRPWVDEVFAQLDPQVRADWHCQDGDSVAPDQLLLSLEGPSRSLLTGERSALNFLQLLSGTATRSADYARLVDGTGVRVLDTRKTIPGLRHAQKYAVRCGGCDNHRIGLFDAFLVKENHIAACGSIKAAVLAARQQEPDKPLEVEVETLDQLREALAAGVDSMLLDNFGVARLREAVAITAGQAKLEASGGITRQTLRQVAETGIDFISIGALTKDAVALDLSMRFVD